ncbi:Clp protease N-terminal domain-containing protein [Streptomyces sp. NPDC051041]|uniref:Clp protease N-terminal domain-containing protein n=1 Tax=Streptomyces sp. NPDC051041 TaxID=3365640 RepID=UPI00379E2FAC
MRYGSAAKKVLGLPFREALRLGHDHAGTEHLLPALLEHENGTGVLSCPGLDKGRAEEYLAETLSLIAREGAEREEQPDRD